MHQRITVLGGADDRSLSADDGRGAFRRGERIRHRPRSEADNADASENFQASPNHDLRSTMSATELALRTAATGGSRPLETREPLMRTKRRWGLL